MTQIVLADLVIEVARKEIKHIYLSVYPPAGKVRVSAPLLMSLATIRVFVIAKLEWIKRQQKKLREQERETPREYLNYESHFVWGKRYLLKVIEAEAAPRVQLTQRQLVLQVRPETQEARKQAIVDEWYREQIHLVAPSLIAKWEMQLGVNVARFYVQHMKTKWGSCNSRAGNIRLNTELAKKPPECLEYIVVHEMVHLLEPSHNQRFIALMEQFMPKWRFYRDSLNQLPVKHERWGY